MFMAFMEDDGMSPTRISAAWVAVSVGLLLAVSLAEVRAESAEPGTVIVKGVAAGEFDPAMWQAGSAYSVTHTLNFMNDVRWPILPPLLGGVGNIYNPSAVKTDDGWRVFYGGWDTHYGHDRIYSVETTDFLTFTNRQTVIENGPFQHVCNPSAIQLADGTFHLMATSYPNGGQNKPVHFTSPDGNIWNGTTAPYAPAQADTVVVAGYPGYDTADINGTNAVLYDDADGLFHLYFNDFNRKGETYHAVSADGHSFQYTNSAQTWDYRLANDVKKFTVDGQSYYLMGQHHNGDRHWYSLSTDGETFGGSKELAWYQGSEDRYMVSIGWVTDENRLLGYLYGAGAPISLDRNRIFARWLQKLVVFVGDGGERYVGSGALGPDRQVFDVPEDLSIPGHFEVYSEDGSELLFTSDPLIFSSGGIYVVPEPATLSLLVVAGAMLLRRRRGAGPGPRMVGM